MRSLAGSHRLIWDRFTESDFTPTAERPLALLSYRVDDPPEAFIEPTAVGQPLKQMPLFRTNEVYVYLPLGPVYASSRDVVA